MVGEWWWGRCGVVGVGRLGWGVFLTVGGVGGVGGESTSFSTRLDSLLVDGQGKARQPKEGARLVVSFSSQAAHVWVCAANRGCMFSRVELDSRGWHECGVCAVHTARATCENEGLAALRPTARAKELSRTAVGTPDRGYYQTPRWTSTHVPVRCPTKLENRTHFFLFFFFSFWLTLTPLAALEAKGGAREGGRWCF